MNSLSQMRINTLACGSIAAMAGIAVAQPCTPEWTALPGGGASSEAVDALIGFNDGTGPALYAGGGFGNLGGVSGTANIGRWDGDAWSPVGGGVNGQVFAFTVFDNALYAGGAFTQAGGAGASRIARWDGQWSPLAGGVGDTILGMTVFDDGNGAALYVGGFMATGIARWDGQAWSGVGGGTDGALVALAAFDGALYIGGAFSTAGSTAAANIARWDGQQWSALGAGANGFVRTLTIFNDGGGAALYAGGNFTNQGNRVAKWDGQAWSALGSGTTGEVHALRVFDDGSGSALYVAGLFSSAGGVPDTQRIARWDGTSWSAPGTGGINELVRSLTVFNDGGGAALYAGGRFTLAGGVPAQRVARWGCPPVPPQPCYANCDESTTPPILNVEDFVCFINRFAEGIALSPAQQLTHYANCDNSTTEPILNVEDFICFINEFAAGCP
jgi:hypothetical protein